jgi:hypothetical protein
LPEPGGGLGALGETEAADRSDSDALALPEPGGGLGRPFDDERPGPPAAQGPEALSPPPARTSLLPWQADTVVAHFGQLGPWFLAAPTPVKAISCSVAAIGMLLAVIGIAALARGETRLYADETAALMTGPGSEPPYTQIAELRRGAELLVHSDGSQDGWTLVRDVMGRAGFVKATSLSDHRPVSLPGVRFAGCVQSPIEDRLEPCQTRAQAQLESCRSTCDGDADPTTCTDHCQKQFLSCVRGCEGAAAEVTDFPSSSPTLESPSARSPARVGAPAGSDAAKKKTRKKVRRKKKRRR